MDLPVFSNLVTHTSITPFSSVFSLSAFARTFRRAFSSTGQLFRVALAQQRTERLHEPPECPQRIWSGSGHQRVRQVQHPDATGFPGGGRGSSSSSQQAKGRMHQLSRAVLDRSRIFRGGGARRLAGGLRTEG